MVNGIYFPLCIASGSLLRACWGLSSFSRHTVEHGVFARWGWRLPKCAFSLLCPFLDRSGIACLWRLGWYNVQHGLISSCTLQRLVDSCYFSLVITFPFFGSDDDMFNFASLCYALRGIDNFQKFPVSLIKDKLSTWGCLRQHYDWLLPWLLTLEMEGLP